MKEINSLQSEELRKLAQYLNEKRIAITYFGKAWGNAEGNWVYFNTYLDLGELRQQFAFGEHIKEHQNLDPRSGTESGFIDENTGEGVMGKLRPQQMTLKSFLTITFTVMSLWSFLSFFGCGGSAKSAVETIEHPPFRIQKRSVVDRRFKPNEGTISKITFTKYKPFYKDQPIALPKELDAGSGISGIWKAYFLKDAPIPTMLLGSMNVYLVTEENDAPKVSLVEKHHSDYATLQWLDSENGQPGREMEMLIGKDSTNCTLAGGSLLLINKNTVLRVADLALFPFRVSIDFTDGYYTGKVIGFSPKKDEIVFMGSKNHEIDRLKFIHALLVYNYQTNEAYAVPFDLTETRLHDPYRLEPGWMDTYFEWQPMEDDQYRLVKKNLAQLPNWEGHFDISSNYALAPVTEDMYGVFLNFTKSFLQLKDEDVSPQEYGGIKKYDLKYQDFIFDITYIKDLSSVSFSTSFMSKGPEKEAKARIREVGEAFNEVLSNGDHQALFTSY